jgi:O-antigen/teichoic acid export membrane protein
MSLKRQVAINIVSNWLGYFVQAAAGLVVVPFILRQVGEDAFGVWALLAGLLVYFYILQDAFSLAMNRFAAYYRSDMASVNRYFAATLYLMFALGAGIMSLGVVVSLVVCRVFPIPAALEGDAKMTCVLVGIDLALTAVNSSMIGLLNGFQLYAASNLTKITNSVLRVGMVFWIVAKSPNIVAVQFCYCASSFGSLLVTIVSVIVLISGVRCFVKPGWRAYREIFQYTKHSILRSGSDLFMYATLLPLVSFFGTMRDTTVFSLASRIPNVVRGVLSSAQAVFLPAFSTLFAKEGAAGIIRIVRASTRLNATLTLAVITLSVAYTNPMLHFWLGDKYDPRIVVPMILLLLSVVSRGVFELWYPGLVAMGVLRWLSIMAIMTCVGIILLAAILCNVMDPAKAPAAALLIGLTLRSGLWLPAYGAAKTGLKLSSYLRTTLLRPILATVLSAVVLFMVFRLYPAPTNTLPLTLHGMMSAALVGCIASAVAVPEIAAQCLRTLAAKVRR